MLEPLNLLTKYLLDCVNKCVNDFLVLRNENSMEGKIMKLFHGILKKPLAARKKKTWPR